MLHFDIPGFKDITITQALFDYNGTLAVDGILIKGVADLMVRLSRHVDIHVVTADTFGAVEKQLDGLPCRLCIIPSENQMVQKLDYAKETGLNNTVSIGNGRNDQLILKESILGIAILQKEGVAKETLLNADIVCTSIIDAIELLLSPKRLVASLRA